MALNRIIVVGANIAGLRAVETLRMQGFGGEIFLLGTERHLPYDRPPLSKELLKAEITPAALAYQPQAWYEEQRIELLLGQSATGLDLGARTLTSTAGRLDFDGLIIATGSRPRKLFATHPPAGVYMLRDLDDALRLRQALVPGANLIIVGAGFIGAEIASSARHLGLNVTVLESAPCPLQRALGSRLGAAMGGLHAEHGAQLHCGVTVTGLGGLERVQAVQLSDGRVLAADLVVVGVGVEPNIDWLAGSGLALMNGLCCDEYLGTAAPGVYAAGDVASCTNVWLGERTRGEQWTTAGEQGCLAAQNLLAGPGGRQMFSSPPYFWSDQYGVRIQSIGRVNSATLVPIAGNMAARPFVAAAVDNGKVVGAVAINSPRLFARLRPLVQRKACADALAAFVQS